MCKTEPDWTYQQVEFGEAGSNAPFLTYACSTPWPHATPENLPSVYRKHETEKRRTYEARVRDIEGASFCPIVMAATGGQAPATKALVKQLASSLAEKMDLPYHKTINWLRNRMSFACIKACIMCLRGARSRHRTPQRAWDPYAIETWIQCWTNALLKLDTQWHDPSATPKQGQLPFNLENSGPTKVCAIRDTQTKANCLLTSKTLGQA